MFSTPRTLIALLFSIALSSAVFAQTRGPIGQTSNPIVTATASNGRVRYASLGEVNQTRLQVFSPNGLQVYDSDLRLGNLIDWHLSDQQGQHLTDGSYLFVITVKDFSGVLTQKYGTALLESGQVSLQQTGSDELPEAQALALQDNKLSEVVSRVDRVGAAGPRVAGMTSTEGGVTRDNVPSPKQKTTTTSQSAPTGESLGGTGTQNLIAKWTDNAGTLGNSGLMETGAGSVGIGTTNPNAKLTVSANSGTPPTAPLGVVAYFVNPDDTNTFLTSDAYGSIFHTDFLFRKARGTMAVPAAVQLDDIIGQIQARGYGTTAFSTTARAGIRLITGENWTDSSQGAYISFLTTPTGSTSIAERIRVTPSGNVGIGTTNPGSKLDVSGDLNVTGNAVVAGNIAAKYQDVAEWVEARQPMRPGTVVSLDSTRSNAVIPSRRAYDALIAGVVSTKPGVILGEAGAGKVMVATSGRVLVRVDASKYPIRIGDLLVASSKPGVAMRSRPIRVGGKLIHRPGTIVGKALEVLANGEGQILVLVSLQ